MPFGTLPGLSPRTASIMVFNFRSMLLSNRCRSSRQTSEKKIDAITVKLLVQSPEKLLSVVRNFLRKTRIHFSKLKKHIEEFI